jgi:hypothetical protein
MLPCVYMHIIKIYIGKLPSICSGAELLEPYKIVNIKENSETTGSLKNH